MLTRPEHADHAKYSHDLLTSALPRRITMGMDDMFGWNSNDAQLTRRTAEVTGAYDGASTKQINGLMAGTKVASNLGWRVIEGLAVGDMVLTFDNGMQKIVDIQHQTFWLETPEADPALWPVVVPVDALENRVPLTLMADQGVLVESDAAADVFGDPFSIVPAHMLVGVRGITRQAPAHKIVLIAIYFAHEQVIYAEGGALIHCPSRASTLDTFMETDLSYDVLSVKDAAFVAECIQIEDEMLALATHICRHKCPRIADQSSLASRSGS